MIEHPKKTIETDEKSMQETKVPKYIQIYDYFLNEIKSEHLSANQKLPSESEIMRIFSVSRTVAINALKKLSNDGYIRGEVGKGSFVNEKDITKIFNEAKLPKKRVHIIVPEIRDLFSSSMVKRIFHKLYKNNFYCSIHYSENKPEYEADFIDYALETKADGIIIFPCDQDTYSPQLLSIIQKNIPTVLVDRDLVGLGLSCVSTNSIGAMEMATNHLLDLNHRKIALFSKTPMLVFTTSERLNGFFSEMNAYNVSVDPTHILVDKTGENAEELVKRLYEIIEKKLVTAIVCLNSHDFETVYQAVYDKGFSCPEDFSIIHFDSISRDMLYIKQTTNIRQNSWEIGDKVVEVLMESMKQKRNLNKKIVIEPIFIEGSTTRKI